MYAVIRAGGKQHKVAPGDVIEVERLKEGSDRLELTPVLVVDEHGTARATPSDLAGAAVSVQVLGETKGPKLRILKYRNKTNYRRRAGHRQRYSRIRIDDISIPSAPASAPRAT